MSETGRYVLPASEWVGFRGKLIAGWNSYQARRLEADRIVYRRLLAQSAGRHDFDYRTAYLALIDEMPVELRADRFQDATTNLTLRTTRSVPHSLREPQEFDYPPIAVRSVDASINIAGASIILKGGSREAHWSVSVSGASIERARSHSIAQIFFSSFQRIKWAPRTGGYVLFTESGPKGKPAASTTIRDPHGPIGALAVAARDCENRFSSSGVRIVKPGMR